MCWPYWPEQLAPILENLEKARSIFGKARLLHDEQEKFTSPRWIFPPPTG